MSPGKASCCLKTSSADRTSIPGTVGQLAADFGGSLRFGTPPPPRGRETAIGRLRAVDHVAQGDVAVIDNENAFESLVLAQTAFHQGALGVVSQWPLVPGDGRFTLTVARLSECLVQYAANCLKARECVVVLLDNEESDRSSVGALCEQLLRLVMPRPRHVRWHRGGSREGILELAWHSERAVFITGLPATGLPRLTEIAGTVGLISPPGCWLGAKTVAPPTFDELAFRQAVCPGGCLIRPGGRGSDATLGPAIPTRSHDVVSYGMASDNHVRLVHAPSGLELLLAPRWSINLSGLNLRAAWNLTAAAATARVLSCQVALVAKSTYRVLTHLRNEVPNSWAV